MEELDQVLSRRESRTARARPISSLYEKVNRATFLLNYAQKAIGNTGKKIKSEARRQYIISLVTAFEVFVGDTVIELIDKGNVKVNKSILESIKKRYDILEIENILKNKITIGELVSDQVNFQNIDITFSFLSKLFDTNFYDLLYKNKFTYKSVNKVVVTVVIRKGSHNKLARLINMRHAFVHDMTFNNTPSYSEVIDYGILTKRIATCIYVKTDQYNTPITKITKK